MTLRKDNDGMEEGRPFTEEELEELFKAADEEEEQPRPLIGSPRFRKLVVIGLALMLCAQVLAFLPKTYSIDAIRFLAVSAELSLSDEIQRYKRSVVVVRTEEAKGTGFIVTADGLVVTNRHVVGDAQRPVVSLPSGDSYAAQVLAIHPKADLALLDLDAVRLPALPLADGYGGEAGLPVYIIGNPLFFNGIANKGETLGLLPVFDPPAIGLQAPIYKGNSGSPVISRNGAVIGVVYATSRIERDGAKRKIGLAIPVDRVHELRAMRP